MYIYEESISLTKSKLNFMKKLIVMSLAALFLASCGGSKKGAWSDEDKEKFQSKCKDELGKTMGENTNKLCDCMLEKVEDEFETYDEADKGMNNEVGTKIAEECATQVMKDALKDVKIPETPAVDEEPIENPAAEEEMPAEEM